MRILRKMALLTRSPTSLPFNNSSVDVGHPYSNILHLEGEKHVPNIQALLLKAIRKLYFVNITKQNCVIYVF